MTHHSVTRTLSDLSFAVYEIESGDVDTYDPIDDSWVWHGNPIQGDAERAVERLFETTLGYGVRNIDHKQKYPLQNALGLKLNHSRRSFISYPPEWVPEYLTNEIVSKSSSVGDADPLDLVERDGIPDLLVYTKESPHECTLVEVKMPPETFEPTQIEWFKQFPFLDIRVACVFESQNQRDQFISSYTVEKLLQNVAQEAPDRPELPPSELRDVIEQVEVGDRILFNERQSPYTVVSTDATRSTNQREVSGIEVQSRNGNTYVLSEAGDWYCGNGPYCRSLWWAELITDS
ncbi:VRR-NUC domain-containing protein [Salinigranum rubrum]|uniref:VRR-NUC domain-containing protein n=1 Tax=Salinigranum rubrum TaxID=755307 RepID=UPI000D6D9707